MSNSRQLRLGAFMRPVSIHTAAWRYPGGLPDANFNFQHLARFAQTLEHGRFDAFFTADHLAVLNMPIEALKRSATVTSFDPFILLPALAVVAEHLGLIATASTTYNEPYHVARKFAPLDSLVHYDSAIASLSIALGHDASRFDPDSPLPKIPESNASKSGRERIIELARREGLTVRQLAQRVGGYSGLAFVGTPATIADQMEEWLFTEASDGFNIMFPYLPAGLDDFVYRVVPELQQRGLFRREYEGATLRENLGLPRPPNRFFPGATV